MLLYDGLHYDAMAVAAFDGAPEELDVTILQVCGVQQRGVPVMCVLSKEPGTGARGSACFVLSSATIDWPCEHAAASRRPLALACVHVCVPTLRCCTPLQVGSADAGAAAGGAERLVAACHAARQFTDTANFTLRCGVCQIGIKGEKEAVEHAKATGHQNFAGACSWLCGCATHVTRMFCSFVGIESDASKFPLLPLLPPPPLLLLLLSCGASQSTDWALGVRNAHQLGGLVTILCVWRCCKHAICDTASKVCDPIGRHCCVIQ
jgi:hypothetical protein